MGNVGTRWRMKVSFLGSTEVYNVDDETKDNLLEAAQQRWRYNFYSLDDETVIIDFAGADIVAFLPVA